MATGGSAGAATGGGSGAAGSSGESGGAGASGSTGVGGSAGAPPTSSHKPRVINTTDLGADPDDEQSMVRQLVARVLSGLCRLEDERHGGRRR
jgi:hypothetical protein